MPRILLRKTRLFSNQGNLSQLKSGQKGFAIIFKPKSDKILDIKKKLKEAISKIHRVSRSKVFNVFRLINSILLGWGQYFYFGQGCVYGKMLDQYVFINLRKALVKKFRYKGLLRPKWVAHNFIGLNQMNPNKKAWQFRGLKYISKTKKWSYEYIWPLGDTFSRLSITSFLIDRKIRSFSYYDDPSKFQGIMSKNISRRLVDDIKFKMFQKQKGICLLCKRPIKEKSLLNRSTAVHIHHIVPRSLKKLLGIADKLYESRRNLILLHGNCHLILHKTVKINESFYLRDKIPKEPIIS